MSSAGYGSPSYDRSVCSDYESEFTDSGTADGYVYVTAGSQWCPCRQCWDVWGDVPSVGRTAAAGVLLSLYVGLLLLGVATVWAFLV